MLPTLEQLKGSSLQAAITLSLVSVGKTEEEISAAMGWSAAQHARFFRSHDFWPALPNLPRYCSIVGNHVLALWIIANAEFVVEQCQPMDAITLFKSLADLFVQMGSLAHEAHAALEDGKVDQLEAKRLLRRLSEILSSSYGMVPRLQATINASR